MDFETTFKENRQTLLNLARAHGLKCGNMIPTEDFYSQGCETFIKCFNNYDPEKAQFNTYFISSIKTYFKGMIVKETVRSINHVSTRQVVAMEYEIGDLDFKTTKSRLIFSNNDNLKNTVDPEHRVSFMDRLSKLSSDAIEVVMLVLKTPSDFVDDLSKSTIRSFLIKRWKCRQGVPAQERVKFAFSEIKETLNDF